MERPRWIVVGPVPPPLQGGAFMTTHVLEGLRRADALEAHLDTSDDRPIYTTNRLDPTNVLLAIEHAWRWALILRRHRGGRVLIPISQGRWGFLRDAVLIAMARLARRPVVVHLHGGLIDVFYREAPRWERWLIRRVLAEVEAAWVLTEAQADIFDGLIARERVSILENTSEDVAAASASRDEGETSAARDQDELRLLFLSNLFVKKGPLDLIEALEQLGERARGISLRLIGEAHPDVAAEVARRGAALARQGVSVAYDGPRVGAEKIAAYRWADAYALPSRYPPEGQPLTLLEAMSAGLPIVASDHAGIPWTVRDGIEGLIVGAGDVPALAGALLTLREDPELRARLGRAARARYEQRYSNEAFYGALARLAAAPVVGSPSAAAER